MKAFTFVNPVVCRSCKEEVASTLAEGSFFRALSLLKLYTGHQYHIYSEFRQTSKNFEGGHQNIRIRIRIRIIYFSSTNELMNIRRQNITIM
jgi:hypothetical protein